MRYLFTYDAAKPQAGVKFDAVTRAGGQLFGTFATEDSDMADEVLAAAGNFVKEITKEDYDLYQQKKKLLIASQRHFQMPDPEQLTRLPAGPADKAASAKPSVTSLDDILTPKPLR